MAEVQLATLAAEAREAIDSEDLARAADACRRALLHFPRWVEGYWLLGHILVESGYVAQARSCFEAVASAMPDDPRAYQGLADVAEQQHDPATAVAGLLRALDVGEGSQSVLTELRRLQQQAGFQIDDSLADSNARVAHTRLVAGQFEDADVAAERALHDEPERLDMLVVQAVARLFGGDRRGSETVCRQLLDLSPDCLKALAILRYLVPGEETAPLAADIAALDPEDRTLVWLRSQMTTLGYEADDLPSAPRLVAWQEEEEPGRDGVRTIRPLDRLIPELEDVWPQWLQQAAQTTPEALAGEPAAPPEAPPPPPPFDQEIAAPSAPSFLGDVDTLAREFEDAMRSTPSGGQQAPATAAPEQPVAEPATEVPEPVTAPADWLLQQREDQVPLTEAERPAAAEVSEAPPVAAPVNPADEFAQWQTPAAPAAEAESEAEAAARAVERVGAPNPPETDPAPVTPVAPEATAAEQIPGGEWGSVAAPVAKEEHEPKAADPAIDTQDDLTALRTAAQAAITAGDHWSAIDHYGEVLARMRATSAR